MVPLAQRYYEALRLPTAHLAALRCLSSTIARAVFGFFPGMQAASSDNTIADHLDTIRRARSAVAQERFTLEDRVALRADPGQSQSGSSSLSPRAYRARSTTAELAVSEILPITSVRAPRNYAGRSPRGREDNLPKVAGQIGGLR